MSVLLAMRIARRVVFAAALLAGLGPFRAALFAATLSVPIGLAPESPTPFFTPGPSLTLDVVHSTTGSGFYEATPITLLPTPDGQLLGLSVGFGSPAPTAAVVGSLTATTTPNYGPLWVFDALDDFTVGVPAATLWGTTTTTFVQEVDFGGSTILQDLTFSFVVRGLEIVQTGPALLTELPPPPVFPPSAPPIDFPIRFQVDAPVELQMLVDVWLDLPDFDLAAPLPLLTGGALTASATLTGEMVGAARSFTPVFFPDNGFLMFEGTVPASTLTGNFTLPWAIGPGDLSDDLTVTALSQLELALAIDPVAFDLEGGFSVPEPAGGLLAVWGLAVLLAARAGPALKRRPNCSRTATRPAIV